MRTREFVIAEHRDLGYTGLAPNWMPGHQADPLQGMGAAHDVLEHGSHDTVEWQGLGGSLWVRPEWYYSRRIGNPDRAENIASEWENLFFLYDGVALPNPPKTRPVDVDEELRHIIAKGNCNVRDALRGDSRYELALLWTSPIQTERMLGWMRLGYRAAQRRWKGIDPYMLCETFLAIEQTADKVLKHYESYPGAKALLRFDPRRAFAQFTVEDVYE